jgi:sugar/nucleoside kinase (ribokinase family)
MSWTERFAPLSVTVVGNPGLDTLVLVGEDEPDLRADGHFVRNVDTVGHAAAFTARALARLGHRVRVLGSVGGDAMGRMVTDVLAADGVDTSLLFTDPAGTARSVNLVFPDGRRTFFYDGGSHMTLQPPDELVVEALAGADLVVASLPNWARAVLPRARTAGIPVAVDLQDARMLDDPYRADFVSHADHLFASGAHLPDPASAACRWLGAGPAQQVVLGMGPRGALLAQRRDDADPDVVLQPPAPSDLPILDTTGCGDSLAVGFLDGLLAVGLDPASSLRRGQALARIVASATGNDAPFDRQTLDSALAG